MLLALAVMMIPAVAHAVRVIEKENPKMTVYLPDKNKATGRAVIVLPGGAYAMHAIGHEGKDLAPFFNARGIATIVVEYTLPEGDRNKPMNDVKNAIRTVRENAKAWNIDPDQVGIMGSSAGGHLASTIATHTSGVEKPDFQILFYPVISMQPGLTHDQTCANFLGKNPSQQLLDEYSNDKQVKKDTPRALILMSEDDNAVPIENGTQYYEALHKAGVPVSYHIYPSGGHGWGLLPTFKYHNEMLNEISSWLKSF